MFGFFGGLFKFLRGQLQILGGFLEFLRGFLFAIRLGGGFLGFASFFCGSLESFFGFL